MKKIVLGEKQKIKIYLKMENLTLEEIKQYLKDNLSINIETEHNKDNFCKTITSTTIKVKLYLDDVLISESEDTI